MHEDNVDAQLDVLCGRLYPGGHLAAAAQRMSAGATMEMWTFDCVAPDGSSRGFVLRRSPRHRPGGTLPLSTEAAVIAAAGRNGVKVAAPAYVLEKNDRLGDGFVMHRLTGETLAKRILGGAAFAGARTKLPIELAQAVANIHRVPRATLPELPRMDWDAHLASIAQRLGSLTRPRPVFTLALSWLKRRTLDQGEITALVHGDFRVGNIMVAQGGLEAVLDWEAAHLGNPVEDLAWFCMPPWRFEKYARIAGGLSSAAAFLDAYAEAGGIHVTAEDFKSWLMLSSLRWGTGCAEMAEWIREGKDANVERAMIARRVSESEIDILRLLDDRDGAAHD